MPELCERDHEEMRRMNSGLQLALAGMERDLHSMRRLVEALTNALRDNAISFAGHDKGQADLKAQIMSELEQVRDRLGSLEEDLQALRRLQDEARDAHEEFAEVGELVRRNRDLLLEIVGLTATLNPPPLARDLTEMLRLLRILTDRDPKTGEPLEGWAMIWPRLKQAFLTALAAAGLALAYKHLAPHLPFAR